MPIWPPKQLLRLFMECTTTPPSGKADRAWVQPIWISRRGTADTHTCFLRSAVDASCLSYLTIKSFLRLT